MIYRSKSRRMGCSLNWSYINYGELRCDSVMIALKTMNYKLQLVFVLMWVFGLEHVVPPGSYENEAIENEDRSTKHPNLENEAPKTRKRSTQPWLENEAPKSRNHCRLKNYNFKSCMTQAKPGGGNGCVKALKWPRIVVPSSVQESARVWTFDHVYFWLIVFQIDHVSLTSTDSYRCHSLYCLARVFQNLPAPHKHYGVFDVFADFPSFSNLKTSGCT